MAKVSPLMLLPPVLFAGIAAMFVLGMNREDPNALPSTLTGRREPAVVVAQLADMPVFSDADLKDGKVKLVNFWASWCAPCQAEIPRLVRMQQRYGDKGFQVVGVGIDTARPLANVRRSLGINYPILVLDPDRAGPLLRLWGNAARYVPYSVLVDRDNRVVYRQSGEVEDTVFADFISPRL